MKKILAVLTVLLCFFLAACYEVNEEVVVNADGSGTYSTRMDMSGLIELALSFAGEEELRKDGLESSKDTTILFDTYADTAQGLSEKQRALYRSGKMRIQMNMAEKKFLADINFKFQDLEDLQLLMSGTGMKSFGSAMQTVFPRTDSSEMAMQPKKEAELDQLSQIYDVTVNKNTISRTLNRERYEKLMAMPEMDQMQQMTNMGIEILYTTTIRLPRPIKKSDNAMIKLSDDKKTATFKFNVIESFKNPEKFAYKLEY